LDFDAVADELYGVPPGDFTATRDARSQEARAAGERELAERIHRLRRPTTAAWASNLLVREQPDEARTLLELGEALRQAHHDLDGSQLRVLSARQHRITAGLARQAQELTARAGRRIGDDAQREVAETLHAALADPQLGEEWIAGRLSKPLTAPVGFATGEAPAAEALSEPPEPDRSKGDTRQRTDRAKRQPQTEKAQRQQRQKNQQSQLLQQRQDRQARQARQRLEKARAEARDAERRLTAREEERSAAQKESDRAEDRHSRADQRVAELRELLRQAQGEQRAARKAAQSARDHMRRSDRAADKARQHAEETAARLGKLTG
jgi:hypothetical protein